MSTDGLMTCGPIDTTGRGKDFEKSFKKIYAIIYQTTAVCSRGKEIRQPKAKNHKCPHRINEGKGLKLKLRLNE